MTLEQAMAIGMREMRQLSNEQLKEVERVLVGATRSRVYRITKAGLYSPAVANVGQIRKGGTRSQTLAAIRQTRRFISSKTSTVKGVKQFHRAAESGGYQEQIADPRFWQQARRALAGVGPSVGSDTVLHKVANVYTNDPENAAEQTIRYFVGEDNDDIPDNSSDEWYPVGHDTQWG